ncbi:MAG: hypothetical protein WA908_03465, partial [Pontixanthobacter sp.]
MIERDGSLVLDSEVETPLPDGPQVDPVRRIILVPPTAILSITLPHMPGSARDLTRLLAQEAPILTSDLTWTKPIPDGEEKARISIVRRADLDTIVCNAEREHRQFFEARTPDGTRRFLYKSPAVKRARIWTASIWIAALSMLSIAAIVQLRDAETPVELEAPVASANASGSAVASAFAQPGIVSALRNQPFDALPGDLLTAVT